MKDQFAAQREAYAAAIKLESAAQISALDWHGNHYADSALFRLCNRFAKAQVDARNFDEAKHAIFLMEFHGMGESGVISDDDLQEFIETYEEEWNRPFLVG